MDWAGKISSLIGIAWTWPLVCMSLVVIHLYGHAAWDAYQTRRKVRRRIHWLALGITTAYSGECLDDLFWAVTWSFYYLEWSISDWLIQVGPIPNVPFRNLLGTFGVYCHIRAVFVERADEGRSVKLLNRCVLLTLLIGHLFALMLYYLK